MGINRRLKRRLIEIGNHSETGTVYKDKEEIADLLTLQTEHILKYELFEDRVSYYVQKPGMPFTSEAAMKLLDITPTDSQRVDWYRRIMDTMIGISVCASAAALVIALLSLTK